jgi:hypothetical protein
MNAQQARGRLLFSTRSYPTFGRGIYSETNPPSTVTTSPYYWWFRFLQLNEDYAACARRESDAHVEVVSDLGDVSSIDFKTWWRAHDWLFAEEKRGYTMGVAELHADLAPFDSAEAINLVVPLTWSRRALLKRFRELVLTRIPEQQPGIQVEGSTARYTLGRWNIDAMAMAHKVYTTKRDNPNLVWADVAVRCGIKGTEGMRERDRRAEFVDQRRQATILAVRYNGYALGYIKAAASRSFPR